jgi:hypothetical protein
MPTLFTGGSVFDGHRHLPDHGLLVDDGKVVAVLRPPSLEALDQPADVVDLAGGLVSPGFTDAHCHPIQGGLERMQCDLTDGSTREEYVAMVRAYAAGFGGPWITGGGWALAAFPGGTPSAADLDAVVADRPVLLHNRDHHGAWANSRALELAGITASRSSPGWKTLPSIWPRCGLSFQLSFAVIREPLDPRNSSTGSLRTLFAGMPALASDGPIPRKITGLDAFPLMMNPPIITRSPVSTRKRVEILRA